MLPKLALLACLLATPALAQTRIGDVQGAAHRSPLLGQEVEVTGVVTLVSGNGFWMQDAAGDGNDATADGIFVFTRTLPQVLPGQSVQARGPVSEFRASGRDQDLTFTQIGAGTVTVVPGAAVLPTPVALGRTGRAIPDRNVDDDGLAAFEPATDAIDFFESLEGMLVRIPGPRVVSPVNRFGEVWVVADNGAGIAGINRRGGITLLEGDPQPEAIQLQLDREHGVALEPGDRLGDVVGVVHYAFGNFEVRPTHGLVPTRIGRPADRTLLARGDRQLLIATYNVENLDPVLENLARLQRNTGGTSVTGDADDDLGNGRYDRLARHIAVSMGAPDIVALQEIQDNDGAEDTGETAADRTLGLLAERIWAAGGPEYRFAEVPPANGSSGGQPGGNIRNAFLFDPARVALVGTPSAIDDAGGAFTGSRRPLEARFRFGDRELVLVNVHFSSKSGSDPLFGERQPPVDRGAEPRARQVAAVAARLRALRAAEPALPFVVLGDFNAFPFSDTVLTLATDPALDMESLLEKLPAAERYTTQFEGRVQALDQVVASRSLAAAAEIDIVHVNSDVIDRASDHDPIVVRLRF